MVGKQQLTLGLKLAQDTTFENFYPGPNQMVVTALANLELTHQAQFVFLTGPKASGKTHLLQALCHKFLALGKLCQYLTFKQFVSNTPWWQNLQNLHLVCLDDIEILIASPGGQEQLFYCYNNLYAAGGILVVAANQLPKHLNVKLPDLQSRLLSGLIYKLQSLSDCEKIAAIRLRAERQGLRLSTVVAEYLLTHFNRNLPELYNLLDRLDEAALVAHRRLTIPFIKEILNAG